jgi:hypothetical protein
MQLENLENKLLEQIDSEFDIFDQAEFLSVR